MGNFPYPHGFAGTKRVQKFIDYLSSINITPRILVLRQGGEQVAISQLSGYCNSVYYRTIGYGLKLGPSLLYKLPLFFILGAYFLLKWRKKHSANYLYCYNGLDIENLFFVLLAKAVGYYNIFDVVEEFSYLQEQPHLLAKVKNKSWVFLDRHIFKIADGIVVISKYLKNKYDQRNHKQIPVQLIPISAKCCSFGSETKRSANSPVKFVYAGSFAEKDDLLTLIKAFERVQRRKKNCKLLLTGKGSQVQLVKHEIREHRSIKYVGYLPEGKFYEFLAKADVLCMTRTNSAYANAGFPFKLGEYLATGKPVIASNVGDVGIYLRDGQDAFLVNPGDIDALEGAIEYCIDNYGEAVKIGKNGMEKCRNFFNPEMNGKLLLDLIVDLRQT
jgi:glycosyltransferase involved in cell wall biosynthesis